MSAMEKVMRKFIIILTLSAVAPVIAMQLGSYTQAHTQNNKRSYEKVDPMQRKKQAVEKHPQITNPKPPFDSCMRGKNGACHFY